MIINPIESKCPYVFIKSELPVLKELGKSIDDEFYNKLYTNYNKTTERILQEILGTMGHLLNSNLYKRITKITFKIRPEYVEYYLDYKPGSKLNIFLLSTEMISDNGIGTYNQPGIKYTSILTEKNLKYFINLIDNENS